MLGSLVLMAATTTDAVLAKRARITELVQIGKRVGYGLFLLAIVLFFVGFFTTFKSWMVTVTVASLVIGSIILAPAIVFGYGSRPPSATTVSTADSDRSECRSAGERRPQRLGSHGGGLDGEGRDPGHLEEAVDHGGVLHHLGRDASGRQLLAVGPTLVT